MSRRSRALVALGSNLGDRRANLDAAVAMLQETPGVDIRAVSAFHATKPAGGPGGQDDFLNAVALLSTALNPRALLDALHAIEARSGRVRELRWGPRVLDLDLLLHGARRVDSPSLSLPHPRMTVRRFVLAPAVEVAPRMVDPRTGRTLGDLLASLDRRPSYLAVFAPPGPGRADLLARLVAALHPVVIELDRAGGDELLAAYPQPGESPGFDRQYRAALAALSAVRPGEGARWLIGDFWVDQFLVGSMLRYASTTCRLLPFSDSFHAARPTLYPPTFVAFWDPPADGIDRHLFVAADPHPPTDDVRDHHRASWLRLRAVYDDYLDSGRVRDPVLRLTHDDPAEAAAEILAACAASRPG